MTIRKGDVFRHEVAGAGGYGDPLEREVAAVERDVRNELVSPAAARADYGVVIEAGTADHAATLRLRQQLRQARGWSEPPAVTRD
jgi:N-methylhydantoinase B